MPRSKYKHFGIISSWCNNSLTSNDIMSSYIGNMKNSLASLHSTVVVVVAVYVDDTVLDV